MNTTSSVSEILTNTMGNTTTGLNKYNNIKHSCLITPDYESSQYLDVTYLLDYLADLTNPKFRKWYCKVFHKLGRARVMELASLAKQEGREPKKLFSLLLKQNY